MRTIILALSLILFGAAAQAQVNLPSAPRPPARTEPAPPSAAAIENAAWQACANARTTGPCEAYLRNYPRGSFAGTARTRMDDMTAAANAARAERERQAAERAARPVAPPVVVDREPQLWAACEAGTTVAPCERYLGSFPSGPSVDKARSRITALNTAAAEKAAFVQCQASTTPGLCETFIATYPASSLVAAAKAQSAVIASQAAQRAAADKQAADARAAAERQQAADREAAIRAQAAIDADKAAFAPCRDGSSVAACQTYLAAAANGAFRAAAQARITAIEAAGAEAAAFESCRSATTAEACLAFGRSFPTSANAGQAAALARDRNAAAAAQQAEAAAWALCEPGQATVQCDKYLATYPQGPHAGAAQAIVARINKDAQDARAREQEQASWSLCESGSTVLPCQQYLAAYAAGRFVGAAQTRIKVLETGPTEPEAVAALGLVVKRNAKSQLEIVSVQGNSSAIGQVFGGDIITTINNKPYDPRMLPKAALDAGIAQDNGRVELLITRGAVPVSKVLRARR